MTSHVEVSNRRPHQGNILPSALRTCAQRAIDMCIYRRARDVGVVCCGRYAKKKQFSRWPHRADIRLEKLKQISSQAKATSDRTQANIKMLLNLSFNKNAIIGAIFGSTPPELFRRTGMGRLRGVNNKPWVIPDQSNTWQIYTGTSIRQEQLPPW